MKKILIILAILLLTTYNTYASILGDVNNDNKVSSLDYILVRKHLLGTTNLTNDQKIKADVNKDNKISSLDYIKIKQIVINGETITSTPTINPNQTYIETYFLNTATHSSFSKTFEPNNSFIIKTVNGKYILIDTGVKTTEIKSLIYNKLKELQKKYNVTIDYLIISHLHSDHCGNVNDIIADSKITIKNIILKKEKLGIGTYNIFEKNAKNKKINIIESSLLKEGISYSLDNNVKMYLFNTKDIYANESNCKTNQKYYELEFSSKTGKELAKDTNNNYIYINGEEYVKDYNLKLHTSTNVNWNPNGINSSFYGYPVIMSTNCNANANSIGIIFQIKTNSGNKYMYISGDIENNGYLFFGEYDNNYKTIIHGQPSSYYYEYKIVNDKPQFVIENNKFVKNKTIPIVRNAAEYKTAKTISNTFNDIKNNLVIYQSSHHGCNNSKDAIDALNINRKGVYTIAAGYNSIMTSNNLRCQIANQNISNTTIMSSGSRNINGIKCTINGSGKTVCDNY